MTGFKDGIYREVRADINDLGEKLEKLILQTRSDLMDAVKRGRAAALEAPLTPPHP